MIIKLLGPDRHLNLVPYIQFRHNPSECGNQISFHCSIYIHTHNLVTHTHTCDLQWIICCVSCSTFTVWNDSSASQSTWRVKVGGSYNLWHTLKHTISIKCCECCLNGRFFHSVRELTHHLQSICNVTFTIRPIMKSKQPFQMERLLRKISIFHWSCSPLSEPFLFELLFIVLSGDNQK